MKILLFINVNNRIVKNYRLHINLQTQHGIIRKNYCLYGTRHLAIRNLGLRKVMKLEESKWADKLV